MERNRDRAIAQTELDLRNQERQQLRLLSARKRVPDAIEVDECLLDLICSHLLLIEIMELTIDLGQLQICLCDSLLYVSDAVSERTAWILFESQLTNLAMIARQLPSELNVCDSSSARPCCVAIIAWRIISSRSLCVSLRCSRFTSALHVLFLAKTRCFGDVELREGFVGNEIKRLG